MNHTDLARYDRMMANETIARLKADDAALAKPARKPAKAPKQARAGIIYRGPSMIDGSPIVAIATYTKSNRKTGAVLQTYILRDDKTPIEAIRDGSDAAICGDCVHRGNGKDYGTRSCYVNVAQGVTVVYKAFLRGIYPVADGAARCDLGKDRIVRLGTYGDPAAVPVYVWRELLLLSAAHTGYTHQWRNPAFKALRDMTMASADSPEDRNEAAAMGWRTFRVRDEAEAIMPAEFICPASHEAGQKVTCAQCKACGGNDGRKGSPVIIAHGTLARRFAINVSRGA